MSNTNDKKCQTIWIIICSEQPERRKMKIDYKHPEFAVWHLAETSVKLIPCGVGYNNAEPIHLVYARQNAKERRTERKQKQFKIKTNSTMKHLKSLILLMVILAYTNYRAQAQIVMSSDNSFSNLSGIRTISRSFGSPAKVMTYYYEKTTYKNVFVFPNSSSS